MALPTLTTSEITQITKEEGIQTSSAAVFNALNTAKVVRITELQLIDDLFKRFFDYYHINIISKYDDEYQFLQGRQITSPIIEADIIDASNVTGRLKPTPPATSITRIAEFDGGSITTNPANETEHQVEASNATNTLQNGYGTATTTTATTTTTITSSSTTVSITNTVIETIEVGKTYVVDDGTNIAIIQINSLVDGTGGNPPFLSDLTITIKVPPLTTLTTSATFIEFTGFTNSERNTKIASDTSLQSLMNTLVNDLETALNARTTALITQTTALDLNQDPDGTTQITTATTNANTAKTFITDYLVSTDISNTGITLLDNERTTRTTEITGRITEIVANYASQSENYYDKRYNFANDRADQLRGSLRIQKITEASSAISIQYGNNATAAADSFSSILP